MRSRKSLESEDLNSDGAGRRTNESQISGTNRLEGEREIDDSGLDSDLENEDNLEPQSPAQARPRHQNHHHGHQHHHHHHHHHHQTQEHVKELIKPDPTVRAETRARVIQVPRSPSGRVLPTKPEPRVATVVDDKQLHRRFLESRSNRVRDPPDSRGRDSGGSRGRRRSESRPRSPKAGARGKPDSDSNSASTSSSSSSSSSSSGSSRGRTRSPPPAAIVIPASVAKSLSARSSSANRKSQQSSSGQQSAPISLEHLEYGPLLKSNEVQVLFRSPDSNSSSESDRHLKDEQAKLVAPNVRQSPISIMTMNPTYELQNKPLTIEYPATVENLRLNNTGFSWEVKIPYQISMTTALYGAHLNTAYRYRLDQFHCHWGSDDNQGSEHRVDNRSYSAEIHFVHYNMEKYRTMSKAARHPDGLVVLSVFLDAQENHHKHSELEKIVSHLKCVPSKGEHSIIKQAVRIENLLPSNKSYWSYQGSLTTPPYFESVTWFVFKHPIKCNRNQIKKFRNLKSSLGNEEDNHIRSNHRKPQPLNGRTIVNYDES